MSSATARSRERTFFAIMTVAILAAVLLGFARTFFLRPWFPDIVAEFAAPEPYFLVHGAFFAAWFALLVVQASLVSTGRVDLNRKLGTWGAGLAALMLVLGVLGVLIAVRRPIGFMGVPVPPLTFMIQPLTVPILAWDLITRGRPHSATLWGGLALIVSQPLRWTLAGTDAWLGFARWATGLPG